MGEEPQKDPKKKPDNFPDDRAFTVILQMILDGVRQDQMEFGWFRRLNINSKQELCRFLVNRFKTKKNAGMEKTNSEYTGCDLTEADCLGALTNPSGFDSGDRWGSWSGTHEGSWFPDVGTKIDDKAEWAEPSKERTHDPQNDLDGNGQPREYDFQKVHWPGRTCGKDGWNQSHPDVEYVWGWDPKENGEENGNIGAHVGFPFKSGDCEFIIWITKKEAFLEAVNTSHPVPGRKKSSTGLGGCGQWEIN